MINLLAKDFKLLFGKEKSIVKRILSILITLIFVGCFVAIEVFLLITILKKIGNIHQAPIAFMTLFLTVISVMVMISNIFRANKLFFNEKDIEQLSVHPVSNASIIFSKLVFLFITHYGTTIVFTYPLFIAYGSIITKGAWFYYLGLFYPVLSFFFEMGIALILAYPFHLLQKFLNKQIIVRFVISIIVLIIGSLLYSKVLDLFITLVASNNINTLFTAESIDFFINLKKYEFPANFLVDIFVSKQLYKIFIYLSVVLGVFVLGCSVTIFAFSYIRNVTFNSLRKSKENKFKVLNVNQALIKKELVLITRNPDYMFSYVGLLIVQPFLALLVIKSLNTIFSTGVFAYYISVVPSFIPLMDILLLMLFTVIISQGASQYISMERKTIKVIKTIPVGIIRQLVIKVGIPFLLSMISLVITLIVLLIGRTINFLTFSSGLILVSVLLFIYMMISLHEELNIRNRKPRSSFKSNIYSYLLPIAYFVVTAIFSYFGLNIVLSYVIGLLVIVIIGIPEIIYLKKHVQSLFMDLDVVN